MQRADSLEKTLVLGKTEGKRRSGGQRMECEETSGDSEGPGGLSCDSPWGRKESDMILRQYSNKINTAPSTYELPSYVWLCKAMLLNL